MTPEQLLGRRVALRIRRLAPAGAFLAVDDADPTAGAPTILLPGNEVPAGAKVGDELRVFVHLDSEERPIATLRTPRLALGEVAFLAVTAITGIGAFVDWGMGKELLVPFSKQSKPLSVGERQPIGLYLDKSSRLAGTMFVGELLDVVPHGYALDQWVEGEAWRNEPGLGLFVILDRAHVGMVPAAEPHQLARGDRARCRIADLLPDGKLVLTLRKHAYQEITGDAAKILAALAEPGAPQVGDRSSPEKIRALFGLSKKAFKRAVGRLLADGKVNTDPEGHVVVAPPPPRK